MICSERAEKESRLKLTKCNATKSHGVGVGFSISNVIKYRIVQWSWMTRIEIYIEFSNWQIMRDVSKGSLNTAVNLRATLSQTMEWIRINRKWENRTWDVSFLMSFSREHLFFSFENLKYIYGLKGRMQKWGINQKWKRDWMPDRARSQTRRRLHLILAKRLRRIKGGDWIGGVEKKKESSDLCNKKK